MKLYEITSTIDKIVSDLEQAEESGDQHRIDSLKEAMDDWTGDLESKVVGIVATRESLLAEADAIKVIIKRQQARVKALEARAEWLEGYVIGVMKQAGKNDIKTPEMRVRISVGTGAVEITDPTKLPDRYFHTVTSVELSKTELRAELLELKKAGKPPVIEGAHLVFNEKLKIG